MTIFVLEEEAYKEEEDKKLMEWEKERAEDYFDEQTQKDSESISIRVKGLTER